MLFNAYKVYNYSGEYYRYTLVTDPNNPDYTLEQYSAIPEAIRINITTTLSGDLVILADAKLQIKGRIAKILDKNSIEVYPDGVWQISQTQPIVNALGLTEGYRYRAKIISGNV